MVVCVTTLTMTVFDVVKCCQQSTDDPHLLITVIVQLCVHHCGDWTYVTVSRSSVGVSYKTCPLRLRAYVYPIHTACPTRRNSTAVSS